MNKYGLTALKSAQNYEDAYSIVEIWSRSVKTVFPLSKSSQKKSCPKNTFLSLCEEGLIKGIPEGTYTKSIKNKEYALKAVELSKNFEKVIEIRKNLFDKALESNLFNNKKFSKEFYENLEKIYLKQSP